MGAAASTAKSAIEAKKAEGAEKVTKQEVHETLVANGMTEEDAQAACADKEDEMPIDDAIALIDASCTSTEGDAAPAEGDAAPAEEAAAPAEEEAAPAEGDAAPAEEAAAPAEEAA